MIFLGLNLIGDTMAVCIAIYIMRQIYPLRRDKLPLRIAGAAVGIVLQVLGDFLNTGDVARAINPITMFLLMLLVTRLFVQCHGKLYWLYLAWIMMCLLVADLCACFLVPFVSNQTMEEVYRQQMHIFSYLLLYVFYLILGRCSAIFFKKNRQMVLRWYELIAYLLLAALEGAISIYLMQTYWANHGSILIFVFLLGFLVLDSYLIYVFTRFSQQRDLERKYDLMQQQSQMQLQVYQELSRKYENSLQLIHDVKRHVRAIEGLAAQQSTGQAASYRQTLFQALDRFCPEVDCQNPVLQVILNHTLTRAEEKGIVVSMNLAEAQPPSLSDMDLTVICSNLLDNALDACCLLPEGKRRMSISTENRMGLWIFQVSNPCPENLPAEETNGSTKPGHLGIGLFNVQKTAETHQGFLQIERKHGKFTAAVTIPIHGENS